MQRETTTQRNVKRLDNVHKNSKNAKIDNVLYGAVASNEAIDVQR